MKDDLAEDDFDDDDDDKTSTAGGGGVGGGVFTSPELSGGQGAGAENGGDVERMRAFNVRPLRDNNHTLSNFGSRGFCKRFKLKD